MKKMARAIIVPKRTPSVVSVCIRVLKLSGPKARAVRILTAMADIIMGIPKKTPAAPPANAAWDIVNPMDEMFIWVIMTLIIAQPIEAKNMDSTA
jgi:hypothetical protein